MLQVRAQRPASNGHHHLPRRLRAIHHFPAISAPRDLSVMLHLIHPRSGTLRPCYPLHLLHLHNMDRRLQRNAECPLRRTMLNPHLCPRRLCPQSRPLPRCPTCSPTRSTVLDSSMHGRRTSLIVPLDGSRPRACKRRPVCCLDAQAWGPRPHRCPKVRSPSRCSPVRCRPLAVKLSRRCRPARQPRRQ